MNTTTRAALAAAALALATGAGAQRSIDSAIADARAALHRSERSRAIAERDYDNVDEQERMEATAEEVKGACRAYLLSNSPENEFTYFRRRAGSKATGMAGACIMYRLGLADSKPAAAK